MIHEKDCPFCNGIGREYLRYEKPIVQPMAGDERPIELPLCADHWRLVLRTVNDLLDKQDRSTVPDIMIRQPEEEVA